MIVKFFHVIRKGLFVCGMSRNLMHLQTNQMTAQIRTQTFRLPECSRRIMGASGHSFFVPVSRGSTRVVKTKLCASSKISLKNRMRKMRRKLKSLYKQNKHWTTWCKKNVSAKPCILQSN
ncbi:hypothetical protein FGIG_03689 [Fasciola gigantica]|uniref:Uncharacterized protein n=1 Tax=Fasciola gigantica TaxID=46835 RepID=A0A504YDC0_FASGI|nr:hypothetical protein FGIG_03689 [Fasciola gigantica]